jgi:hypothetical protein
MMYVYFNPVSRDIVSLSPKIVKGAKLPYFISVDYEKLTPIMLSEKNWRKKYKVVDGDDGNKFIQEVEELFQNHFHDKENSTAKFDASEFSLSSFYSWDEYLNPFKQVSSVQSSGAQLTMLIEGSKAYINASKKIIPWLSGQRAKMKLFIADKNNFNILYDTQVIVVNDLAKKKNVEIDFNFNPDDVIVFTNTNFRSQVYEVKNT